MQTPNSKLFVILESAGVAEFFSFDLDFSLYRKQLYTYCIELKVTG